MDGFFRNLARLEHSHLTAKIGILEKDGTRKKQQFRKVGGQNIRVTARSITLAEVAMFQEFGVVNCPERSFIRSTFDKNIGRWTEEFERILYGAVMNGRSFEGVLHVIAETIMSDIKATIIRISTSEKNSAATIAAKGFSSPLIATRELLRSVNYEVSE